MTEGTAGTLVSLFIVGSIIMIMVVGAFCVKDKVYQEIEKTGQIRIYNDLYKCEYAGKYISEERFIPKEITVNDLPKEVQKKMEIK